MRIKFLICMILSFLFISICSAQRELVVQWTCAPLFKDHLVLQKVYEDNGLKDISRVIDSAPRDSIILIPRGVNCFIAGVKDRFVKVFVVNLPGPWYTISDVFVVDSEK